MLIELTGRVNEDGHVDIVWPEGLPVGEIRVLVESIDAAVETADEALWQAQFNRSPQVIDALIDEALAEDAAGLTDDWDAETDPRRP